MNPTEKLATLFLFLLFLIFSYIASVVGKALIKKIFPQQEVATPSDIEECSNYPAGDYD